MAESIDQWSERGREQDPDSSLSLLQNKWLLLPFLIAGAILRFYHLGRHSLWADEGFSIYMGAMDPGHFVSFISHHDAHPPLYYALVHLVLQIGKSELILRIPSALFGILTLYISYLFAQRLFDKRVAAITLFLTALSASLVYVTQEVRMYPMFILLSLLSTYLFYEVIHDKGIQSRILYALAATLMIYTHYLGMAVLFSHLCALLILYRKWDILKRLLITYIAVIALFLPWSGILLTQLRAGTGPTFLPSFDLDSLINTFLAFFSGFTFFMRPATPEYFIILIFSLLIPIAGIFFITAKTKEHRNGTGFILIQLLIPILLLSFASMTRLRHLYSIKYLTFLIPLYLILLSHLLSYIFQSKKRIVAVLFLLTYLSVNSIALYNWYFIPGFQKQRWSEAIAYVNEKSRNDDAYLIQDFFQIHCLEYYLKGEKDIYMVLPGSAAESLEKIMSTHGRIWYIASCGWRIRDPELKVVSWLERNMRQADSRTYGIVDPYADIMLILYENKD